MFLAALVAYRLLLRLIELLRPRLRRMGLRDRRRGLRRLGGERLRNRGGERHLGGGPRPPRIGDIRRASGRLRGINIGATVTCK